VVIRGVADHRLSENAGAEPVQCGCARRIAPGLPRVSAAKPWERPRAAGARVGHAPGDRPRKAGEKKLKTEIESCAGNNSRACKANPCAVGGDSGAKRGRPREWAG
jgi:hypothetical protein